MATQNGTHPNGNSTESVPATIAGRVLAVNDRGFKLGEQWYNVSRYAQGLTLPAKGTEIRATLDRQGFVRQVEILEPEPQPAPVSPAESRAPEAGTPSRDVLIVRQSSLKVALDFIAASTPAEAITLDAVLAAAERLESWVLR